MKRIITIALLVPIVAGASFLWLDRGGGETAELPSCCAVRPAFQDIGEAGAGRIHEVEFSIDNLGRGELRVVGFTTACGVNCCYREITSLPMKIPSGGTARFVCEIKVHESGPFRADMELFVEHVGVQSVPLVVTGRGVADEKP